MSRGGANHVWVVANRELNESFRSRAYWVTMALLVAGVVAILVVPRLFDSNTEWTVGVVGDAPAGLGAALGALADDLDAQLEVDRFDDQGSAAAAVADEEIDVAIVVDDEVTLLRRTRSSSTLVAVAGQAVVFSGIQAQLEQSGLDAATARAALTVPAPTEVVVDDDGSGREALAFVTGLALYLALFMGGVGVATGVAVEKSSRIAEVLVTTVHPTRLMAGKVLGVGLSILLYLVATAVPFFVALVVGAVDLPPATAVDVVAAIGWFVLGYAIYATGFAALGALVDRQEDLGSAIGPFSGVLVLSYFASIQAQNAPDSLLAQITSIFPLSAPIVMPVRIAAGSVEPLEVLAAVVAGLLTLALLIRVGATIYRRALLRGGRRLKVTEVLRG